MFQASKGSKFDYVICEQFIRELWYNMVSKMAAKEEWFYGFSFFLFINISLRFVWVKFALVAMNVRFLNMICNFEIVNC